MMNGEEIILNLINESIASGENSWSGDWAHDSWSNDSWQDSHGW